MAVESAAYLGPHNTAVFHWPQVDRPLTCTRTSPSLIHPPSLTHPSLTLTHPPLTLTHPLHTGLRAVGVA